VQGRQRFDDGLPADPACILRPVNVGMERSAARGSERYRIADLLVDVGRQCVTRGEVPIPLPKLSFDLLLALVRAAPNVVSHDELMSRVWPRLVVSPETVSQRVKLLRDALGDDPREPRYIASLRGRGYRLLPPVEPIGDQAGAAVPAMDPETATPVRPPAVRNRRRRVAIGILAALALGAIAVLIVMTLRTPTSAPAPQSKVTVVALPPRTVAVLPFENLSPDAHDEFVAAGIAEGVLHRLAGIHELTVISRTSSFALGAQRTDARRIGLKLNARYLVGGSVQRADERLRVTAQLIDATTGAQLWSLRFDRTIGDVFAMEDEISHSVARALQVSLGPREHPFARFGIDAYLAFMQGRAFVATGKVKDAERAVERFARAAEIAPDFAAAYVALADAHLHLANLTATSDTSPPMVAALRQAQPLLDRALQLDDSLGEAYVLRADIRNYEGDLVGAEADYRKGLALSPSYGVGHEHFAQFLFLRGERFDEALASIDRARSVDPLTPRNHYLKGLMLHGRSIQQSEALFLQTLAIAPDFHPALTRLAVIRAYDQARFAEAVKLAEQAVAIDPRAVWIASRPVHFYLELEDVDAARSFVEEQPESVRPGLWVPICLFQRQPARAAAILRASTDRWTDSLAEDVEAYVIRDAALAVGELARAEAELEELPSENRGIYGTITLAQVNLALGNRRKAEELARSVLNSQPKPSDWPVLSAHPQAIALALLGQHAAAIERLEQNFERGWRKRWWYAFQREPAFEPLRSDSRFQALADKARAHAAAQHELLEEMRARSEVPRRAAGADSGPC